LKPRFNQISLIYSVYTQWRGDTALQAGRSRARFPMVSLEILLTSFRAHYGPELAWSSNRNEYQEYFLEAKGGQCLRLITLLSSCADCHEIWESQTPGTHRAFNRRHRSPWYTQIANCLWKESLHLADQYTCIQYICRNIAQSLIYLKSTKKNTLWHYTYPMCQIFVW
jgi:hypothetical protein